MYRNQDFEKRMSFLRSFCFTLGSINIILIVICSARQVMLNRTKKYLSFHCFIGLNLHVLIRIEDFVWLKIEVGRHCYESPNGLDASF